MAAVVAVAFGALAVFVLVENRSGVPLIFLGPLLIPATIALFCGWFAVAR